MATCPRCTKLYHSDTPLCPACIIETKDKKIEELEAQLPERDPEHGYVVSCKFAVPGGCEPAGLAKQLKEDYENACATIAKMHEAAVGEITGPNRGVVEDVEDLRKRKEKLESVLRPIVERFREHLDQKPGDDIKDPPTEAEVMALALIGFRVMKEAADVLDGV